MDLVAKAFKVNSFGVASKVKPKKMPFLHPKAKPFNAMQAQQKYAEKPRVSRVVRNVEAGNANDPAVIRDAIKVARKAPVGPSAPGKVKRALSGQDYGETISRLGRATRRQKKEFSAVVHPLSGRVMDMRRGNDISGGIGASKVRADRKSTRKMARLADKSSNPTVRSRAMANLTGENKNIVGPQPVTVHNHPAIHHKGRTSYRRYPSGADLQLAGSLPNSRHVVLSHKPGPRGSRQTQATTMQVTNLNNLSRSAPSMMAQDMKTMKPLARQVARQQGIRRKDVNEMVDTLRGGSKRLKSYDTFMRQKSGTPQRTKKSGLRTQVTMHKRANPFGVEL